MQRDYELLIIGGGPAAIQGGLNASFEGIDVGIILQGPPGGQIGETPLVENLLGLPLDGLSGHELIVRGVHQAQQFGAKFIHSQSGAMQLSSHRRGWTIATDDRGDFKTTAVILAVGLRWQKHPLIEGLANTRRVYYGPHKTGRVKPDRYAVIGSGNAAAQGILHLANRDCTVYVLCRHGLDCSQQLAKRISGHQNIRVLTGTECESIECHDTDNEYELLMSGGNRLVMGGVFVMIGQRPNTEWLADSGIALENSAILTIDNRHTNLQGVWAIGDCRAGVLRHSVQNAIGDANQAFQSLWAYIRGNTRPSGQSVSQLTQVREHDATTEHLEYFG